MNTPTGKTTEAHVCECGHPVENHSTIGCMVFTEKDRLYGARTVCKCDIPNEAFQVDELLASLTERDQLIAAQQERITELEDVLARICANPKVQDEIENNSITNYLIRDARQALKS